MSDNTVTKENIANDFTLQKQLLERQIDSLNQKILAVQSHVLTLEQANRVLEQMAQSERDGIQKSKYYGAIRNNIELLTKLYSVIKEFEDVKFRYHKEIDDVLNNKFRLIAVEIRRIDEKIGEATSFNLIEFFEKLSNTFSNSEKRDQIKAVLGENPEYQL
ncbi:MAG TPA: hypothetical protein PLL26_06225 [Candidatus Dojkabacteria bacterium]|nr:hypothetical protein [Candidatus Dojkabacteria bacterium]